MSVDDSTDGNDHGGGRAVVGGVVGSSEDDEEGMCYYSIKALFSKTWNRAIT